MGLLRSNRLHGFLPFTLTPLLCVIAVRTAWAQEIILGVTYNCNGDKVIVDSCDIHDLSDTSHCFVGHPDKVKDGLMAYENSTRGTLKKLLPTCRQPSAREIAAHEAFVKRQQAIQDANEKRANEQMNAARDANAGYPGQQKPISPEQRDLNRCVTSGRVMATCTGNSLMGAFNQMVGQVLPDLAKTLPPGPEVAGNFEGAGKWRVEFTDRAAALKCSELVAEPYPYSLQFKDNHAVVTIATVPKPTVLTLRGEGDLAGSGPFTLDGHIIVGYTHGGSVGGTAGHYETQQVTTHQELTPLEAQPYAGQSGLTQNGQTYDMASTSTQSVYVPGGGAPAHSGPQPIYGPKRATCTAPALSSRNAAPSGTDVATGMLKSLFNNGDKGPSTPPGIRMHGIFAASTGFSAQFFPESVILGCGPDAARAYPYTVAANGPQPIIRVDAPEHPLTLVYRPDGSLDPGSSAAYLVHGRTIVGQNGDEFTFAPLERTCDLAVLTPSKTIPTGGGSALAAASGGGSGLSTAAAPLGNAVLSVVSGLPAQAGVPNPLGFQPFVLLRDSYANTLARNGIAVPPGMSPYKYVGTTCMSRSPICQQAIQAVQASAIAGVRADGNGRGTLAGVPPGTYYLMISVTYNKQPLVWQQAVQVHSGQNSITLDLTNATPSN